MTPEGPAPAATIPSISIATATLKRRLLSLIYEILILAAVLLLATLPMVMLTQGWAHQWARVALQLWLLATCGAFYVWQWSGTGQTLPMKTWKLRLVTRDGSPVSRSRALARYAVVLLSVSCLGVGFLWAVVDRDKQFLHDRLAGTRLISDSGQAG